jgi:RNA polymerase primary sigma factor
MHKKMVKPKVTTPEVKMGGARVVPKTTEVPHKRRGRPPKKPLFPTPGAIEGGAAKVAAPGSPGNAPPAGAVPTPAGKAGQPPVDPNKPVTPFDLTEKVKDLVRLAQEQGHLTYDDINDVLPDNIVTPEILDDLYSKLTALEVEIVDQAEVDRVKPAEPEEEPEDEKDRLDVLDDPVRNRKSRSVNGSRMQKTNSSGSSVALGLRPRNTLPWPKNCFPNRPKNGLTASSLTKRSKTETSI